MQRGGLWLLASSSTAKFASVRAGKVSPPPPAHMEGRLEGGGTEKLPLQGDNLTSTATRVGKGEKISGEQLTKSTPMVEM